MKIDAHLVGFSTTALRSLVSHKRIKVLIAVGTLLLIAPIAAPANGPCSCADRADLINQLNKASAALNTIQQYLKAVDPNSISKTGDIASPPNPSALTWKQMIDGAIFDSINSVEDLNAKIIGISLDSATCKGTVTAGTECLRSVASKIAPARQAHCLTPGAGGASTRVYLSELSDEYRKQIAEIMKYLRDLDCPFEYWFGVITYNEVTSQNLADGKGENMENSITRTGKILLNGSDLRPFSTWEVGGKYVFTKTGSSWSYCTATDRRNNKRTAYETNFRQAWGRSGGRSLNIDIDIGEPEDNRVPVSFRVPQISVTQTGTTITSRKDGCPNSSTDHTSPINVEMDYSSSPYGSSAPYFMADPEKISGSEVTEIPDGTIRVTYNLYRFGKPKIGGRRN